jgi:hypothetical protein
MTPELMACKTGIEIVPAAFTDHEALVLRVTIPDTERNRRRGRWRLDPVLVVEEFMKNKIRFVWGKWKRSRQYYANEVMWWERCVKPQI